MHRLTEKERKLRAYLHDPGGISVYWFDQVGSTMDLAFTMDEEPTVVVADHQAAGRGRFQRRWHSPPGSLSLSLLLAEFDYRVPYSMVASLSVYRTLETLLQHDRQNPLGTGGAAPPRIPETGPPPVETGLRLKWVNDVLYHGKKVAGILTEERKGRTVIGIGVNLNCSSLPRDISAAATSVLIERGCRIDPVSFAAGLLNNLLSLIDRVHRDELWEVLLQWEEASAVRGRLVRVLCEDGSEYRGTAEGIDTDTGALLLHDGEGKRHLIYDGSLEELFS